MLVVHDVVMSLAVHGFRRFFFINGHGGNVATVTAAFDEIYAARSLGGPRRIRAVPHAVLVGRAALQGAERGTVSRRQRQPRHRFGGVALAVSTIRQSIKHAQMSPKVAAPSAQFFDAADYRARYPDGRIGSDPSQSSPEHGERLYKAAVEDMIEAYKAFLDY